MAKRAKKALVYGLLTERKFHAYSTHSRALKVYERCRRMGIKVEFLSADVQRGDPYRKVPLFSVWARLDEAVAS